jgi:hypothetical protein
LAFAEEAVGSLALALGYEVDAAFEAANGDEQ